MADHTVVKSVHATLSGTTADTVNLGNEWGVAEVINRSTDSTDAPLYVSAAVDDDGVLVPAVAEADDTDVVLPGEAVLINLQSAGLSIVGDGNDFSVIGVE